MFVSTLTCVCFQTMSLLAGFLPFFGLLTLVSSVPRKCVVVVVVVDDNWVQLHGVCWFSTNTVNAVQIWLYSVHCMSRHGWIPWHLWPFLISCLSLTVLTIKLEVHLVFAPVWAVPRLLLYSHDKGFIGSITWHFQDRYLHFTFPVCGEWLYLWLPGCLIIYSKGEAPLPWLTSETR